MAYLNKDEATKVFEIAIGNTLNEKYEEALKSAKEARLINPELPGIKRLVTLLQVMSADPDTTHYKILGVQETANENEIRMAYRKLAVDLNPDTNIFPKASDAFRRISEAIGVLSDDRLKYDSDLAAAREARAREVRALVAEYEAIFSDPFDIFAPARVAKLDALHSKDFIVDREALPRAVAESEAMFGKYSVIASDIRARYFGAFEALHGRDFLVDCKARARTIPGFKPVFGKDVVVAPERGALFDVVEAFNVFDTNNDGWISSSELQAALQARAQAVPDSKAMFGKKVIVAPEGGALFDVAEAFKFFETNDGMISSSELRAAFEAYDEEPQSTNHHPSEKGSVCSSNEVAGRGTKRSNTTQATLTHPVPKKKMDGQSPLFFK